jgi:hypothetical protein
VLFVQLQDSRQFREETSTLADGSADNIDFHQADLKLDQLSSAPLSLTLWRQELAYGGQRLIGAVGYHNLAAPSMRSSCATVQNPGST